ncbi:MAG: hypothetical protein JO295_05000 [Verrucomicrobia bacterium]|nr:hypothetical protein [Verrucomicrobiota bacterium]
MPRFAMAGPLRRILPPATEARTVEGGRMCEPKGADPEGGASGLGEAGLLPAWFERTAEICAGRGFITAGWGGTGATAGG